MSHLRVIRQHQMKASIPLTADQNKFAATRPNQLWVADITFVATWIGFVYVAFITDVFAGISLAGE